MIQSATEDDSCLNSIAFSPVDPMVVASGGSSGTELFDIRQNTFRQFIKIGFVLIKRAEFEHFLFSNAQTRAHVLEY